MDCAWSSGSAGQSASDVFRSGCRPRVFGQEGALGVEDLEAALVFESVGDRAGEEQPVRNPVSGDREPGVVVDELEDRICVRR